MKKNEAMVFLPTVIAIVKLLLYFFAPMIVFTIPMVGDIYGFKGHDLYTLGATLCLFLVIVYVLMTLLSLTSMKKAGMGAALAALILEAVVLFNAAGILPLDKVLAFVNTLPGIGAAAQYLTAGAGILKNFLKPSVWMIISTLLTLVYGFLTLTSQPVYAHKASGTSSGSSSSYRSSSSGSNRAPHL